MPKYYRKKRVFKKSTYRKRRSYRRKTRRFSKVKPDGYYLEKVYAQFDI